jgi:hypothetical protein
LPRVLPLLLLFLVLFSLIQQPGCACDLTHTKYVSTTKEKDHNCCCQMDNRSKFKDDNYCHTSKRCCGKINADTSLVNSFIKVFPDWKHRLIKFIQIRQAVSLKITTNKHLISGLNRPPPDIKGFGSSHTYLYKCAFLV